MARTSKTGIADTQAVTAAPVDPFRLSLRVVCDACGSLSRASWVKREEDPSEAILAVDKCGCDVPPWKPIESAPKDGTRILLAQHKEAWFGYWDVEIESEGGQCWRLEDPDMQRFDAVYDSEPTHWMPLPDPPESRDA